MSDRTKGYILGVLAAAAYGTNPLFALPLYGCGMSPDSVLFWRYVAALPVLALMIVIRGRSFRVSLPQVGLLVMMGLLVAFSSLALFMSYNYMDVGVASTLLFVYPVMVALIMALCFHEKIPMTTALAIAVTVGGIAMLLGDGGGGEAPGHDSMRGTLCVTGSALSYAIYIVAVNRTSLVKVATLTVTFYVLLFGVALFGVRLVSAGTVEMPPADQWYLWGCVAGLAILPTAISFACTTGAIQYIGSTPTAILGALEPVTAVIIGVAVFGERMTMETFIGLILIVWGVTMVIAGPKLAHPLTHIKKLFPRRR